MKIERYMTKFKGVLDRLNILKVLYKRRRVIRMKSRIKEKHVENVKVVIDRVELLKRLPKNAIVAEIGVGDGELSEKISSIVRPKVLYLIDTWSSDAGPE